MSYLQVPVLVSQGGTSATNAASARTNLGITAIATQTVTQYAILIGGAGNTISSVGAASTAGQLFQSGGPSANPAYTTATYPSTATATGVLLRADGTNWSATTATFPNTTTINQLLYSSSNNVIVGLATANSSALVTDGSGVPGFSASPTLTGLTLTGSGLAPLTIVSTDAGATGGPIFEVYRDSASPAANDTAGRIHFYGKDSGAGKQSYGIIQSIIISPTAASELGSLDFYATINGSDFLQMRLRGDGGQYRGNTANTPPTGYIGERLTATSGSVSISNATPKTIISKDLTAGNWLVQGWINFGGALTGVTIVADVSATDNTLSDNYQQFPFVPTASSNARVNTGWRFVSIASTTTYYVVAQANFTVGTATAVAQIDAIRIG